MDGNVAAVTKHDGVRFHRLSVETDLAHSVLAFLFLVVADSCGFYCACSTATITPTRGGNRPRCRQLIKKGGGERTQFIRSTEKTAGNMHRSDS